MKKLLALLLLLLPLSLPAQQLNSAGGNLTAASASCLATNCLSIRLYVGTGTVSVTLSGTFSATASFEQSGDFGATWVAASPATSTSTGTTQFSVAALTNFRVRVSTYVSGTVAATIISSTASSGASGNISPTGISSSTAGVFTQGAPTMNENFLFSTGTSCNTLNILGLGSASGVGLTDGIASCMRVPSSGVTNGFSNAFGAYTQIDNTNATGQFGWVGGVGYYAQTYCSVGSGCHAWGANFSVGDASGATGTTLFGNEYDITIKNTTTVGAGTIYSVRGTAQPTFDNFPGVQLQTGTTARFTAGFETQAASLSASSTNAYAAVNIGPQESGTNQDSAFLYFNANNGSAITSTMHLSQDNYTFFGSKALVMQTSPSAGNPGGFGISLRSTAALSVNQLVKLDTSNNDAVVICTTVDTTACMGFVQGTGVSCPASGSFCGLITVPGTRAVGILGTGTCAIGNNVIVDTTTNGRVKCQAGIPAQGSWIGIAMSAQATIGSLVDILTKFQ